jgi:CDP-diacylglycerol pyrophosphatase
MNLPYLLVIKIENFMTQHIFNSKMENIDDAIRIFVNDNCMTDENIIHKLFPTTQRKTNTGQNIEKCSDLKNQFILNTNIHISLDDFNMKMNNLGFE